MNCCAMVMLCGDMERSVFVGRTAGGIDAFEADSSAVSPRSSHREPLSLFFKKLFLKSLLSIPSPCLILCLNKEKSQKKNH